MQCDPSFVLVVGVALIWLVVLSHWHCRSAKAKRDPKPGCPLCKPEAELLPSVSTPPAPPPRMSFIQGRRRHVDTSGPFCPQDSCAYHGRVGWGNIRAKGHRGGRCWRQGVCLSGKRHFLETHGTPFYGKQVEPDKLVWAVAALAEGLGLRAVARVFETDATTILRWLVEAAEHLEACSRHVAHDLEVEQVQRDELCAVLSAVKDGEVSEEQAITRLSRSPHWVWGAMDPVYKLILAVDVGNRGLVMAQRLLHQVTQVLMPDCAPLFLTDGFREYLTALVTHYGRWRPPECRHDKGPKPTPFIARLNLDLRQHVAAIGRRVNTVCKHEAGLRQPLTLFHTYHNFVLPHASLRQELPALREAGHAGALGEGHTKGRGVVFVGTVAPPEGPEGTGAAKPLLHVVARPEQEEGGRLRTGGDARVRRTEPVRTCTRILSWRV